MHEDLYLGKGCLSDNIYIGKLNKDKTEWLSKRDITNNFLQVVIERWNGYQEEIIDGNGKKYLISCREIVENKEDKE